MDWGGDVALSDEERRLLEQMEQAGLVSALTSSGQREVLVPNRSE